MRAKLPQAVERYLNAYNNKDVDALIGELSDDVVFENISNSGETTRTVGKAQLEALARQAVTAFSSRRQSVIDAVVEPTRVALLVDYDAAVAFDLPNGWKAGQRIQLRGASFFTLDGGQITSIVDLS